LRAANCSAVRIELSWNDAAGGLRYEFALFRKYKAHSLGGLCALEKQILSLPGGTADKRLPLARAALFRAVR